MSFSNLNILDCTLRDGGYYNNWRFDKNLINDYLKTISKITKYVEIGFRFYNFDKSLGDTAFSRPNFIKTLNIPKNLKIGVMINASELIFHGKKDIKKLIKKMFTNQDKKIDFIRIACHSFEVVKILPAIDILLKKFEVMVNIMQISEISETELRQVCKILSNKKIKSLYFADSLGSLTPKDISNKTKIINRYWTGNIGLHAHDNMKNALKNTLHASKNGYTWLDSTILGMGRGAGNTKTEELIKKFKIKEKKDLNNLIDKHFKPLKKKYKWGFNKYYNLAGNFKIHPTYIQTILTDSRYKKFDYYKIISNLKKINATRFNPNELMYSLFQKNISEKKKIVQYRSDLILKKAYLLGSNPLNFKNKAKIENKILSENCFVLALNTTKHINEKLIDYRVLCHPLRLVSEIENLKKINSKIILPSGILPKKLLKKLDQKKFFYHNLIIKPNKYSFKSDYCILPNAMSILFAIAIMVKLKFNEVELFGFDFKKNSKDNSLEMLNNIKNIQKINFKYSKEYNLT